MPELHGLLRRQWQRHVGRDQPAPDMLRSFLQAVSDAYKESDDARRMVERALELSSEELRATNAELRGVLDALPDALFRVCADDRICDVMAGGALPGHSVIQSLLASGTAGSAPGAVEFWKTVRKVRGTQTAATFECAEGPEGRAHCYEVRLLPFVDRDIIGITRDITERKHAEQDRLILGKLESAGILAGGIAHDFNNLLTGMLLNLEMAQLTDRSDPEAARYLREAVQAVSAAKVLTEQLLTFAQGGAPVRRPTRLAGLVRESVPLALIGSNVRESIRLADDLWPAEVDAGQLGQVVRNLVLNAREAMPAGGVVALRAENVVLQPGSNPALPPGDYVRASVSDHGPGIPAEVLPRIFDPYFSTKQRGLQKGMGLGLTICHTIVQQHGGAIVVESPPGAGATFHVYLPACRDAVVEMPATRPEGRPRPGRILVMDDEPAIRAIFRNTLLQLGYEPEIAAEGQSAVELFAKAMAEKRPFDAVLLDLTVRGGMGACEALPALLALDPAVRAVVMSGYGKDEVMRNCARHGFKATLSKPFDRETLRDLLAQVLSA